MGTSHINPVCSLLFLGLIFVFLVMTPAGAEVADEENYDYNVVHSRSLGVIVNKKSRIGKEEMVAMEIAKEDVYRNTNQTLVLHLKVKDSRGEPLRAALAAQELAEEQVEAILGPQTWEETSLVAEQIISSNQHLQNLPILSFADTTPDWATNHWTSLLQFSPNKLDAEMKAIAAIFQSWNWHQTTLIYQDTDISASASITHLSKALKEVNAEINQALALPPFASSDTLSTVLGKLKGQECRVFVVHLSSPLAARLFETAKKMNMMEKDYIWITTDRITSLVHSLNASTLSSMQGVVGVRSYFPEEGKRFQDFCSRFRRRFSIEYPEEERNEAGIFAVQAYDAVWTMALAFNRSKKGGGRKELVQNVQLTNFTGISGKIHFLNQKVASADTFQIVNIYGKRSYRELGFWKNGLGFAESIEENAVYKSSMQSLGLVIWPGGPLYDPPRRWTAAINATTTLRVGVPAKTGYKEYVDVKYEESGKSFSGLAIEVFRETVKRLPSEKRFQFEFVDFNGTHSQLVKCIGSKEFDVAVGDISIVSKRYQYAEFTLPYTETGLLMIVPAEARTSNKAWLFMKPFTAVMWVLIAVVNVYNGFVVWLIERQENPNDLMTGSIFNQIGTLLWLAFNTLFSLQGGRLQSNLSKMLMLVWLFMALVITQTYSANLSSMLTVQRLVPTITSLDELLIKNQSVGFCTGSFLDSYLIDVLRFQRKNLRNYTTTEQYASAFAKKEISAAFLESPYAKLFLSKYSKGFIAAGPTWKVGGFGFALPRGSSLIASLDEALLNVSESGMLFELEKKFITSSECKETQSEDDGRSPSLSPNSFIGLFIITGGTTTFALLIYVFRTGNSMFGIESMWRLMSAVMNNWCSHQMQRFTGRVNNVGQSPGSSSPEIVLNRSPTFSLIA